MLVDQQNAHILPLVDKLVECLFDRRDLCFAIDYEEVLACLWCGSNVLLFFLFCVWGEGGRGVMLAFCFDFRKRR